MPACLGDALVVTRRNGGIELHQSTSQHGVRILPMPSLSQLMSTGAQEGQDCTDVRCCHLDTLGCSMLRSAVCNWSIVTNAQRLYHKANSKFGSTITRFVNEGVMFVSSRSVMRSVSACRTATVAARAKPVATGESDIAAVPESSTPVRKLRTLSKKNAASARSPADSVQSEATSVASPASGLSAEQIAEAEQKV